MAACCRSGDKGDGAIVAVGAAAGDGAQVGIGTADHNGVDVDGKQGCEGGVACDGDGAGIGGVAIAPLDEMAACGRCGRKGGCGVIVIGAGTRHGAQGGIVCHDCEQVGFGKELRGERCVGGYNQGAGIVGNAVAPLDEVIAIGGKGSESGCVEIGEGAAALDRTHRGVAAEEGNGVGVGGKEGGEGSVLRDGDGAGIGSDAVVPHGEMVAVVGYGNDDCLVLVGICASTNGGAHCGVVATKRECGGVGEEDGYEKGVLCDNDGTRIEGVAIVPTLKMVVGIGRGGEYCGGVIAVETRARNGAPGGIVAGDSDVGIVGDKDGGEAGVGRKTELARVGGGAIAPTKEMEAAVCQSLYGCLMVAASGLLENGGIAHSGVVCREVEREGGGLNKVEEILPMVGDHVVEHGSAGHIDRRGGGGRGKGAVVDGGRDDATHLDACDGQDGGIGIVANAGEGCGKDETATHLEAAVESTVANGSKGGRQSRRREADATAEGVAAYGGKAIA